MTYSAKNLTHEVKCQRCHWTGTLGQLKFTIIRTPVLYAGLVCNSIWDESHEPCCPACRSINIICKEDSNG